MFFFIRMVAGGVQAGSTRHVGHWMAYCTCPGLWWWRIWWDVDWQGKPKYSEKTCPSATLSTRNRTWPDPGSNPGRRGGKPANNRFSYGAAITLLCLWLQWLRLARVKESDLWLVLMEVFTGSSTHWLKDGSTTVYLQIQVSACLIRL
jgi:hypothetical protein